MYVDATIKPRWCETDANGHITNTVPPVWFEEGRATLYQASGVPATFLVVRLTLEYLVELRFGHPVTIRTGIGRIGNKSVTLVQEAWQKNRLCSRAEVVQCCWDKQTRASRAIPEDLRDRLSCCQVEFDAEGRIVTVA
ncbi:MAG: thioesterase family protein [Rhodocyclaceae bacterium]|nr:thioesterase family protein [Rhodocyclaceae bacterium]